MSRLFKRWYVWLGLVLLLGLAGSVALILVSPSRINQENFDRIRNGMTIGDVEAILWQNDPLAGRTLGDMNGVHSWESGPNWIDVHFANAMAEGKELHLATVWETLQWYAKKGAEKIGVNWD
jgi:hypothetical protein